MMKEIGLGFLIFIAIVGWIEKLTTQSKLNHVIEFTNYTNINGIVESCDSNFVVLDNGKYLKIIEK